MSRTAWIIANAAGRIHEIIQTTSDIEEILLSTNRFIRDMTEWEDLSDILYTGLIQYCKDNEIRWKNYPEMASQYTDCLKLFAQLEYDYNESV